MVSLTFDGAASNLKMAQELNANISNLPLRTYFLHPQSWEKVYIFLDVVHMLKLIRNCLGSKRVIKTEESNSIDWKFF